MQIINAYFPGPNNYSMCIQLIKRYKLKYKIYNNEIEISNNEIEISNDEIELKTL